MPLANLPTNHHNAAAVATTAQAPHLKAMLDMTGTRKKEACVKLDGFKKQVGDAGITQILKCAGDFPKAYKDAKAFCGTGGAGGGGSTKKPGSGGGGKGSGGGGKPASALKILSDKACIMVSVTHMNLVCR